MFTTRELSKNEFTSIKSPNLLVEEAESNRYFELTINGREFICAYYDHGIPLKAQFVEKHELILIGMGHTALAIAAKNSVVKLCIGLTTPFMEFFEINLGFAIISETTVIKINGDNCSIIKSSNLPDIIEDVYLQDDKIIVTGINGDKYEV